jgi:competence protein ComGC
MKPSYVPSLTSNKSAVLKQTSQIKGQLSSNALLKGQNSSSIKKLKIKGASRVNQNSKGNDDQKSGKQSVLMHSAIHPRP